MLFFLAGLLAVTSGVAADAQGTSDQLPARAAAVALILLALNAVCGVYRQPVSSTLWAAARTGVLLVAGVPLALVFLSLLPSADFPQARFGYVLLLTWVALTPARPLVRPRSRAGRHGRHVLFVDANAAALVEEHLLAGWRGRRHVTDLARADSRFGTAAGWSIAPPDVALADLVSRHRLSEIVVVPTQQRGGVLPLRQLLECRVRGVPIVDLATFIEHRWGELSAETLKASHLIYGEGFRQGAVRRTVKRGCDVVVAASLLAVAWLPMAIIALALWLRNGAPIFERRLRAGRGRHRFELLNFRIDRDVDSVVDDERRPARTGGTLQKYRLDQLPQLFNVLRGDMSIVGPRAVGVDLAAALRERSDFYRLRFSVKPGLLSWAGSGRAPGSLPDIEQELASDLYYVKHHSLTLDLLVLVRHARSFLYGGRALVDGQGGEEGGGEYLPFASRADSPS